jgi:uncharacterized coiled-coil protein SlyX
MEVSELLAGLEAKATESERTISELQAWLIAEQQTLKDVRREAAAVRSAVQRLSGEAGAQSTPSDTSWRGLSHVDAVETALREAGCPMHLTEIADAAVNHGHARMTRANVSATLTHLSQLRGTVVNVGKGRWNYVPPTSAKPNLRVVSDAS